MGLPELEGRGARRRMAVPRLYPEGTSVPKDPLMSGPLLGMSISHRRYLGDMLLHGEKSGPLGMVSLQT